MRTTRLAMGVALALGSGTAVACSSPADPAQDFPPKVFAQRTPLPSCGDFVLGQEDSVPGSAWDCLEQSTSVGAELKVSMPTIEGDPIVTPYRVGPDITGLELFIDNREDQFIAPEHRGWTHQLCPDTVTAVEPLGCFEA